PFRAARVLLERRELWPLALAPALLTLLGLVAGLALSGPASGGLLRLAWREPEGWRLGLWWLTRAAILLALLYAAAVALPIALSAPFADRLSARVEALELGEADAGGLGRMAKEVTVGAWHAAARVTLLLLGYVLLAPSLLVPGAWPLLAFLWTATWASFEWLDLPMARHLHGFAEVRAALRSVRPLGLGFGAVLGALFLVPLANLVVIPVGAVAGTLLYCDLVRSGRVARAGAPPYAPRVSGFSPPPSPPGRPRE
ncbi:MAG TPA: EI24 domain-containing protein, partial [Anaeromyxobacteraceae bacterium]|nr:EI24 domain-containing protein [Anaeromyxobacteraceae bacterium]